VRFHDDTSSPYTEVCAAADDDGLNNSWDHNYWGYWITEIFNEGDAEKRYEVSSWTDAYMEHDTDNDGIYDYPYTCLLGGEYDNVTSIEDVPPGSVTDNHPLIRPTALIDTGVDAIIIPSRIHAGQMNTIIGIVKRSGDEVAPRNFNVTLDVCGVEMDQRSVTLDGWLSKPDATGYVRFGWTPTNASEYNLSVRIEEWNGDPSDNELLINVTTVHSSFEGNYSSNIRDALDYLHGAQNMGGSIGRGLSETPWAVITITAAGDNPYEWGSLMDCLRDHPSENYESNVTVFSNPSGWAAMVLAISSAGEDPRDFGGMNYVLYLKSYYDGEKMGYSNSNYDPYDDALTILALISAGEKPHSSIIQNLIKRLIAEQNPDDGSWEFTHHSDGGRVSHTAIAIQALASAGYVQDTSVTNALNYLRSAQNDDGGFPDDGGSSNSLATAHVIQAIISAGENPDSWRKNGKTPFDCLTDLQHAEGYFNKIPGSSPDSSKIPCTSAAATALAGRPYPVGILRLGSPSYPDMHPIGGIDIPSEIYVSTNSTVKLRVKSNGGRFNVKLLADGMVVDQETVCTVWANDETEVVFAWNPDHDGVYNLSAARFNVTMYVNGTAVDRETVSSVYADSDLSARLYWTPNQTGYYDVRVFLDSEGDVRELDEENNNVTADVLVILPDLVPTGIETDEHVFANETNSIAAALAGAGNRFNATLIEIRGNDTEVMGNVTNISFYGTTSIKLGWTPKESGSHNLRLCLDPDCKLPESNETNNNLTVQIPVYDRIPIVLKNPRGGEQVSESLEIRWEISHDKPVKVDLAYSPNGGESWVKIKENLEGDSYQWDTRGLINGFQYVIKIAARGEYAYGEDRSDLFMINNLVEEVVGLTTTRYFLSTAPDDNNLSWISPDIGANPSSSIIVVDGKVFVYCEDGHIVCINESDGEEIWDTEINRPAFGSWATPAYYDGYVFIASGDPGRLYSIDADTGDIEWQWKFSDGDASVNSGPCIADGKIFIGSEGHYYAVSETHPRPPPQQPFWGFPAGGHSTPAAAYGNVYFGAPNEFRFYAVDADNGTEVWNITTSAEVHGSPTVANGVVYAATCIGSPNNLYAIDAINGDIEWNCGEILPTNSMPAYTPWGYLYITGGYEEAATYCLNAAATGKLIWKNETVGWWTNSPAVSSDKKVFVGKSSGSDMDFVYNGLYCFDALTGEELWHSDCGGSSPFIANGRVYTTGRGKVYAFGSNDLPDLTPLEITTDSSPLIEGINAIINVSVKNEGDAAVGTFSINLSCKRKETGKWEEDVFEGSIESLNPQQIETVSFEWTPAEPGNYSIQATVDPEQTVNEGDITNNRNTTWVEVKPMPDTDLTVTSLDAPSSAYVGESCQIKAEILNLGKNVTNFNVRLAADDAEIGVRNIRGLDFIETKQLKFTWTPTSPGKYTLTIFADYDDRISESNEVNNTRSITVKVQKPLPELIVGGGGGSGGSGNGTGNGSGTGDQAGEMVIPINTTDSSIGGKIRKTLGNLFVNIATDEAMSAGGMSSGKLYTLIFIIAASISIMAYGFWRDTRFTGKITRRK